MQQKTFIIDYTVVSNNGKIVERKKVRAKRKFNAFEAQVKLEEFLKKKHDNFGKMVVHSCNEENYFEQLLNNVFNSTIPWQK